MPRFRRRRSRNQARKEAQELLEESRRQAAQEAEEALAQAKEEGFRQGYADGMSKAQIEGRAAMEEQLHQQELQIKQFLEEASQAREDLMEQTQSELCDLSVAVAEKIIHVSLKSSREVILKMIQMATDRLKRREWVHIYVGGLHRQGAGPDYSGAYRHSGGPVRPHQGDPHGGRRIGHLHHRDARRDH